MSSKIVADDQPSATPMLWRMVAAVGESSTKVVRPDAPRDSARALDQARREGFAEGLAAGREQAEEHFRPAVESIAETLDSLSRLPDVIRKQATQDLVQLAISIAARVIHREVAIDPDALAGLIQAAFLKLQSRELHRVRMHPSLEALVRKSLEHCGSPKNLVLAADTSLAAADTSAMHRRVQA